MAAAGTLTAIDSAYTYEKAFITVQSGYGTRKTFSVDITSVYTDAW